MVQALDVCSQGPAFLLQACYAVGGQQAQVRTHTMEQHMKPTRLIVADLQGVADVRARGLYNSMLLWMFYRPCPSQDECCKC